MHAETSVKFSHSRRMADFAANLKLAEVPPEVVARAKGIVLDGLGCGLFGARLPWTDILAGVVNKLEPHGGHASIWGRGETASAANAALLAVTRGVVEDLAPHNIVANAVNPGPTRTERWITLMNRLAQSSGRTVEDCR